MLRVVDFNTCIRDVVKTEVSVFLHAAAKQAPDTLWSVHGQSQPVRLGFEDAAKNFTSRLPGGDALKVGSTQTLFEVRSRQVPYSGWGDSVFDVSADGQRFLVNSVVTQTTSAPLNLVVNWPALLKK
jgi:hypothetical protein